MSVATQVSAKVFNTAYSYQSTLYVADSIAVTSEEEITIPLPVYNGRVESIRIVCASTDYDIYVLDKTGIDPTAGNSIYTLFAKTGINLVCNEIVDILFANYDDVAAKQIYLYFVNNDGANATGDITMEWVIQRM